MCVFHVPHVALLERGLAKVDVGLEAEVVVAAGESYLEHSAALEVVGSAAGGKHAACAQIDAIVVVARYQDGVGGGALLAGGLLAGVAVEACIARLCGGEHRHDGQQGGGGKVMDKVIHTFLLFFCNSDCVVALGQRERGGVTCFRACA